MINKYQKLLRGKSDEAQFWPSFTDLLSTILLCIILFFICTIAIYTYKLNQANEELRATKQKFEEVTGVKTEILRDLQKMFKDSKLDVDIDEKTGAIIFNSDILFEYNKATLQPKSKGTLKKVIPEYLNVLLSKKYKNDIAEIIIEGHTDNVGSYDSNLRLSQARAYSVAHYVLSDQFPNKKFKKDLQKKLTINGRSSSAPIYDKNGKYDPDKSRRVELKFRLKDDEILKQAQEILKGF